jgi:hypothetical protein
VAHIQATVSLLPTLPSSLRDRGKHIIFPTTFLTMMVHIVNGILTRLDVFIYLYIHSMQSFRFVQDHPV